MFLLILALYQLCQLDPVPFVANPSISFDPHLSLSSWKSEIHFDLVLQ